LHALTKDCAKKYRKLDHDLSRLRSHLASNPLSGTPLGSGLYKIRWASSDISKGKSGAFRIIYYFALRTDIIALLDLYAKNEQESIPVSKVRKILEDYVKGSAS